MGCCGCTLATSTVTAVVLGLLESILGLSWNILVIVVMSHTDIDDNNCTINKSVTSQNASEDYTTTPVPSTQDYNQEHGTHWDTLRYTLQSNSAVCQEHLFEIVITALVLNSFWLITTLGLAVGNAERCRDMLKPWIGTTVVITVTDIAATVYFIFGAIKSVESGDFEISFFDNLFVFCAVLFSRGGPIIWITNIALCVFVAQRVKEIEMLKNKRMPFDSDFMPYSLNPPYDAYDTESSTRTTKDLHPPIPPPDYEGLAGKKRRPSFSSDPETMTLPISMSSRGSQRPLSQNSYLYDDRVEVQHRASCTAETVLHHAYENKGLVMDTDGWMGIPRPSLKPYHH
ncbi:uncharacterized protein LOC118199495 [Stegodyphus dumicola]|uniref:uncharacterized protein LOC118199495 n=1 Tax=Stegodyphus dumicola TaxID=202533 RepID=UPI0015B09B92|nr:uncharacterized protein LOC118199495 [Stegodyphus dumicola]